jgi:hypothetical protein
MVTNSVLFTCLAENIVEADKKANDFLSCDVNDVRLVPYIKVETIFDTDIFFTEN